ncbi:virulence factor Mce-like protein [Aeromicrobium panaciterrae]|uniref:Virulence factor Mce-like protein n=1 Tax=Aeromicrobium panaciterrae TaxID=363861 RepID=A0ABU1URQ7_9ACTN|nr:MCE family protein [Aeromicrobium panaciterrae]MDR7087815.1 virulence factor Mce-like protein [Aeromicrobium panaciterrae]
MARTPVLERGLSLKVLGAAFIAMLIFVLWVTYAFFTKAFVDYDKVTLTTDTTGVNLPLNADIKLRGVIVGEVRGVEPDGAGVKMDLGMNPDLIKDVPKGVTAQLIPKTLFGEKYIALIPPAKLTGESLKAGDTITKADVPIEVETLLNDLYPLLDAVDPANLSYTLSAVSSALEGRGKQLGETLVQANSLLQKTNPDIPTLVDDLIKFGKVADGYADAMPDLGAFLRNTVTTGNTIVAKKSQLTAFFDESTKLSNSLTSFTKANGENLATLAKESRPILETVGTYSTTFPCFLKAMGKLIPRLDSAYREGMLHINVEVIAQADAYAPGEELVGSKEKFDAASTGAAAKNGDDIRADNAAVPSCLDLNEINKGDESSSNQGDPFSIPASVYKLIGIKSDHGKFGAPSEFNRAAAVSLADLVQPSVIGIDSESERSELNILLGARLGMNPSDVPDIGSLLVGPMLRGAGVSLS